MYVYTLYTFCQKEYLSSWRLAGLKSNLKHKHWMYGHTNTPTHSLTHSLIHPFTHSLTHSHTHPPTQSLPTHLIGNLCPVFLQSLEADPLSQREAGDAARLGTRYLAIPSIQQVLGNLADNMYTHMYTLSLIHVVYSTSSCTVEPPIKHVCTLYMYLR